MASLLPKRWVALIWTFSCAISLTTFSGSRPSRRSSLADPTTIQTHRRLPRQRPRSHRRRSRRRHATSISNDHGDRNSAGPRALCEPDRRPGPTADGRVRHPPAPERGKRAERGDPERGAPRGRGLDRPKRWRRRRALCSRGAARRALATTARTDRGVHARAADRSTVRRRGLQRGRGPRACSASTRARSTSFNARHRSIRRSPTRTPTRDRLPTTSVATPRRSTAFCVRARSCPNRSSRPRRSCSASTRSVVSRRRPRRARRCGGSSERAKTRAWHK